MERTALSLEIIFFVCSNSFSTLSAYAHNLVQIYTFWRENYYNHKGIEFQVFQSASCGAAEMVLLVSRHFQGDYPRMETLFPVVITHTGHHQQDRE